MKIDFQFVHEPRRKRRGMRSLSRFKKLFDAECNVYANTIEFFEKVYLENISMECLAGEVDATPKELEALREAERCDPRLVVRLCRHLELHSPKTCSRLNED